MSLQRRTTLGTLEASQMNSRQSTGPARVSQTAAAKNKRLTVGPGSFSTRAPLQDASNQARLSAGQPRGSMVPRRSSIFGSRPQAKNDPRPLADKGFQKACIRSLITYLTNHGYNHAISEKLLSTPTSKEFLHIVQFLFHKVDTNIKFGPKIEDEVPLVFKRLRYPFQISKSALQAVGSPHTWPALLAALAWLVDLLNYEERAIAAKERDAFDESGQRLFLEYVEQSYRLFLEGEARDADASLLDEQLAQQFEVRDAETGVDIERLEAANTALRAELDAARTQPAPLEELERKRENLISDVGKFRKLIENLQAHGDMLRKKVDEKTADLAAKRTELAAVAAENQDLTARVAAQSINAEDVARMSKEKLKVEEVLRTVTAQKDRLEKDVWQAEVQLSRHLEELEGAVRSYHAAGDRLKVLPSDAKRAGGLQFELTLHARAARPEDMLSGDLKGVIKPALAAIKDAYTSKTRAAQAEVLGLAEAQDGSEEAVSEKQDAVAQREAALRKVEAACRAEKERGEGEVRGMAAEVAATEELLQQLGSSTGADLHHADQRHQALVAELAEVRAGAAAEREAVTGQVLAALDLLMSHKAYIQETLARVHGIANAMVRDLQPEAA
ncbi:Centromere-associated protein HEC1 [Klebsormidium nitens]|uniref:Kinetochore protein NDC80 n=1 Tax=Klebsormidium nitens TaxID=105231 RepID=A0A1Y1ILS8_KLENI|nr:Centromere-associated protein HEC1 [Klebsormidium nitens]|eukprot:GAQ91593.1 Centromere-associated protein HEC1 [Klebsormidium nitens]